MILQFLEFDFEDTLKSKVFKEYYFTYSEESVGRPFLYLYEPGVWQLLFTANKDEFVKLQKHIFEVVIPNIRAKGFHRSDDITKEQLQQEENEISELMERLEQSEKRLKQSEKEKQEAVEEKIKLLIELDDPITGDPLIYSQSHSKSFDTNPEQKATIFRDDFVYQLRVKVGATNSRSSKAYKAVLEVLKEAKLIPEYCSNLSPTS